MNTVISGSKSGCPFHHGAPTLAAAPAIHQATAYVPEGGFRCPFEVKGRKEGTILEVALSESQVERFAQFADAYETFYANPDIPGICFVVPESVQKAVTNLHEVKAYLFMYQAEMLGMELAHRLRGLWFPEVRNRNRESLTDIEMVRIICAHSLQQAMASTGVSCTGQGELIAGWVYVCWIDAVKKGQTNPHIFISDSFDRQIGMKISPGGAEIIPEREERFAYTCSMNTFSLVKTPFYPETFGRHSDQVEIWVTRETDFLGVNPEARLAIRKSANAPLVATGLVPEADGSKAAQIGGVWIPEDDWLEVDPGPEPGSFQVFKAA
ncbi:MAG TPA: hypothetical protein VGE62_00350 [Candidatus Paceibacterota bacterium]